MATRYSPTMLRRRLGVQLRRFRQEAELTCAQVAAQLRAAQTGTNWSDTKISRVETGRLSVHPGDIEELLRFYGVTGDHHDAIMTIARRARQRGWWHVHGGALPEWFTVFIDIETEASIVRTYQADMVPGLLQTHEYARALLATDPGRTEAELARRVTARLDRQELLERGPRYLVVLDESAIRRVIGGRAVMRAQLAHLAAMTARPHIAIHILPFEAGEFVGVGLGSFTMLEFADVADTTVVFLENLTGALYLEKTSEIQAYSAAFDQMCAVALSRHESAELIAKLAQEL